MTQEEKAKRYDEVLEQLKGLIEGTREDKCAIMEEDIIGIFPELKESKEERIKTFLHHTFTAQYLSEDKLSTWHGEPVVNILSWIEKQGEQKEYTFKALPRLLDMIEPTERAKAYCQKLIDSLVKEGYFTDAKIVGECLKKMNGENVPMAIMDEKQGEQNSDTYKQGYKDAVDNAYKWLEERQSVDLEVPNIEKFINDFKKAMEE